MQKRKGYLGIAKLIMAKTHFLQSHNVEFYSILRNTTVQISVYSL
jgi:hypothetical protein